MVCSFGGVGLIDFKNGISATNALAQANVGQQAKEVCTAIMDDEEIANGFAYADLIFRCDG